MIVKYLLDTDHISFLQRRSGLEFSQLTFRMAQHPLTDFTLSVISFHEQVMGANGFINRSKTNIDMVRGYTLLLEILDGFSNSPVLPLDADAIAMFDEMRRQKVRLATVDLRIATIALSHNLVLLTRNISDFSKVPGLMKEDWTV